MGVSCGLRYIIWRFSGGVRVLRVDLKHFFAVYRRSVVTGGIGLSGGIWGGFETLDLSSLFTDALWSCCAGKGVSDWQFYYTIDIFGEWKCRVLLRRFRSKLKSRGKVLVFDEDGSVLLAMLFLCCWIDFLVLFLCFALVSLIDLWLFACLIYCSRSCCFLSFKAF